MSFDKTNTGALGKNKNKEKETHPDYSGQINVGGADYWLSGWLKANGTTGEKFFSLSVRPKKEKAPAAGKPDFSDEIPF